MTTIFDIPLDAWVIILRFIDKKNLVETFNRLFASRILDIPNSFRIDTFMIVVSQARYLDTKEEECPEINAIVHRNSFDKLVDMGVEKNRASILVQESNGDLEHAMFLIGWTQ
tara:strand:+ start:86 stop:424 length:339 start_codon:yes stop_codon:yes gene_type:complete